MPDDKPSKSVKQGTTPQQSTSGKPSRVTGRIQVSLTVRGGVGNKKPFLGKACQGLINLLILILIVALFVCS